MQSCPKSTKTTLHRVFSGVMLSGAFRATLDRVLTCAILSQEYQGKTVQDFLMQFCLEPLGKHCIVFLPMQCCPKSIKTTLNREIYEINTLIWFSNDFYRINIISKINCCRITTGGCFRSFVKFCIHTGLPN